MIDTLTAGLAQPLPETKLLRLEIPMIDEHGMAMRWIIETGTHRRIFGGKATEDFFQG